jgi:2-polyprenyl-6-methoxyphenol hydroxylase-like FAD-dependent oxidoreductase/predicted DsbA family dithiol-disulfide isomerase
MKAVIIGGGIAGLSLGILLKRQNYDVVICERDTNIPIKGNAFLMHTEGVSILKELTYGGFSNKIFPGSFIDRFSLRRPNDEEVKFQKMQPWQCIKRKEIVEYLYEFFPENNIEYGRNFSHFEYRGTTAVAAVFTNGEKEYGDIFIGSDGGNSKVREELFGKTRFTATEVKEVLGLLRDEDICNRFRNQFTKFQHKSKGISFGMIPASKDELVWYSQYDITINDIDDQSCAECMKDFCKDLLVDFPPIVQEILEKDTFKSSYIWHTKDFDVLPSFHKHNVVLIGDAAHLALPFTSAGTTNALVDAHTLANCLFENNDLQIAFEKYHSLRAPEIAKQIQLGRDLKRDFLYPVEKSDDDLIVPLISKQERSIKKIAGERPISILYFTDPICSTCWAIQPQLRKLQLEYADYVTIEYKMGGLLPSWDNYNRFGITKPSDVAAHWDEVCSYYEMPINKNIWLEDPLPSSYPPSIAFKAAQLQDTGKAVMFLRRIREMVFLEKKNIIKKEFIFSAAYNVGLDAARLIRDLEGKAQMLFREDLVLSDLLEVKELPTLFFSNNKGTQIAVNGYHTYDVFEDTIHQLEPNLVKSNYDTTPAFLFEQFQTMTTKEFSYLRNEQESVSREILEVLFEKKFITRFESPSGNIWINNFEAID